MGTLFDRLCDRATLEATWQQVLKKNARGGLDGRQPPDLEKGIDHILSRLADDLRAQKYVPIPYGKGAKPKFDDKNEWRQLSLPAVIDKIVQEAAVSVIEPVFEREFLDCSYAYCKGKGPVRALKRINHIRRSSPVRWVVTAEIDNFFDSLDHRVLIDSVAARIKEPELLNLISLWLQAGIISIRGDWLEPEEGIAQGAVISPLLSNIYLHPLDCFM
ncbi:MAG: hypothetical protein JRI50_11645, partial [Deltaproteobacteria bacterium]|nr:hypothetical protein [Deltaproteobacteria bacterium]